MEVFDEQALKTQISLVQPIGRIAFAVAAATRQLSNWEWYAKRFDVDHVSLPRKIVDDLWAHLLNEGLGEREWNIALADLDACFPEADSSWTVFHALADDALASLSYAIRALLNGADSQEVCWAARRAYEATDQVAIRLLGIDLDDRENESIIISHPIVQRELSRQWRDVNALLLKLSFEVIGKMKQQALLEPLLTPEEQALDVLGRW